MTTSAANTSIGVPCVLTFAGLDPTGGAGLAADVLAIAALGCHPLTVCAAITAQDTHGVRAYYPLDPAWVEEQARTILEDIPVAGFKVGMLGSPEVAAIVAEIVADYPHVPLVLDPVLASGRGDDLGGDRMAEALLELLVPQSTVVTPNVLELARLTSLDDTDDGADDDDIVPRALQLVEAGAEFVLVTGTHARTPEVVNNLYCAQGLVRSDAWTRLHASFHGSGCTLASALAACLARDLAMGEAVYEAQEYTYQALQYAFRPGMGQHIPDRLFWAKSEDDEEGDDAAPTAKG